MSRFNPLHASAQINEAYRRYLRSLLPLRDSALAGALDEAITSSPLLSNGPLLEANPSYEAGADITELIAEGVLPESFLDFTGPELPANRPLHRHQENAVRKARAGRNLVVATGTGSGKTESFLLPILAHLAEQRAAGTLGPGVRALLLYPMNALANDQMKRLRRLLAAIPDVTFGRYTGDTEESRSKAEDSFHRLNPGEQRLPNELLSREEMRAAPPHLLLTNYAMLEYLLLRPQDTELFANTDSSHWRFVVVDEAHVYDGAKGSELAMLLRRLRDRVGVTEEPRAIATSATVGADRDPTAVTDFATRLFGLPFDWDPDNSERQDLVTAVKPVRITTTAGWGPLPPSSYAELLATENPRTELLRTAREHGWEGDDAAEALRCEARLRRLHELLDEHPRPIRDIAAELVPEQHGDEATETATALVTLAGSVHDSDRTPVLSTRFHFFVRATEGAFSCLGTDQEQHLSLNRRERCERCPRVVFELGGCQRCGAVHLHGAMDKTGLLPRHVPWRAGVDHRHAWLLLEDHDSADPRHVDEDDALLEEGKTTEDSPYHLCVGCGSLHQSIASECPVDECPGTELRPARLIHSQSGVLEHCLACGARGGGLIRLLESGAEAATSVLATSLYQALPPDTSDETVNLPGQGRKLLFFSDSRQTAAYFAPYLKDTHESLAHRGLLLSSLRSWDEEEEGEPATIDDLVPQTARTANRARVFEEDTSRRNRERHAALWTMREVISYHDRQSLEGVGLLRVELARKPHWRPPQQLLELGLTQEESWNLLQELLRTLRTQGAVDMPEDVDADDEAFAPRRGPIHVRMSGSDAKRKVLSWLPTSGTNRRLDYLTRVLRRMGSDTDPRKLLEELWQELTPAKSGDGPAGWLCSETLPRLGTVRRIDHRKLRLRPVRESERLFRCDRCRRILGFGVRGVCPTLRCDGTLEPWYRPAEAEERDHYRHLYQKSDPVPMSVQEHTAQWSNEKAAEIQGEFVRGELNALSCSTTFELGVDVGELQTVVLRNMPPTTANYVQRAGRAGRRADSAALALTYAQRRSHDLFRFSEPEKMIAGETRPPVVPLENARIDRRHAHSVALAAFFRAMKQRYGESWRTAGEFFLPPDPTPPDFVLPVARLSEFLRPVPDPVRASMDEILPESVHRELGVATDSWVAELERLLESTRQELVQDVTAFEERREEAVRQQNYRAAEQYKKVLETLRKRPLINFLATHNVLPKYGFPVDTVELRTDHAKGGRNPGLELTRDLSMAISEYAPGSEVIAGGRRWTSGGVYRLPGRDLVSRYYAVCEACGHYRESVEVPDTECPACHQENTRKTQQYVEPSYGFVASEHTEQKASQAPRRSWTGATYIVDSHADVEENSLTFPTGEMLEWRSGTRGQFVVVNEGPNRTGFQLCQRCGWGRPVGSEKPPRPHRHLLKDGDCEGPLQRFSLAHRYETDFVELRFPPMLLLDHDQETLRSALYALLEGAAVALEISRDDIDGTVHRGEDGVPSLVLFDTTPGGAGSTQRIAHGLVDVVRAAAKRMHDCECGPETSCYGCLRGFRNQRYHELLSRGAALELLHEFVPVAGNAASQGAASENAASDDAGTNGTFPDSVAPNHPTPR
ncbi:ATP-dependent helicase YprA (DUF1998 family)/rubrerythrin [Actinopolyspora lacussalsi]|nr:ATP-dependent helicase YprA (DUF1998 family)/rubrerythrin [Actinopolyspora lacussalsi]